MSPVPGVGEEPSTTTVGVNGATAPGAVNPRIFVAPPLSMIAGSGDKRLMTPATAKLMVSRPERVLAMPMAARKEPTPASLSVVTIIGPDQQFFRIETS